MKRAYSQLVRSTLKTTKKYVTSIRMIKFTGTRVQAILINLLVNKRCVSHSYQIANQSTRVRRLRRGTAWSRVSRIRKTMTSSSLKLSVMIHQLRLPKIMLSLTFQIISFSNIRRSCMKIETRWIWTQGIRWRYILGLTRDSGSRRVSTLTWWSLICLETVVSQTKLNYGDGSVMHWSVSSQVWLHLLWRLLKAHLFNFETA